MRRRPERAVPDFAPGKVGTLAVCAGAALTLLCAGGCYASHGVEGAPPPPDAGPPPRVAGQRLAAGDRTSCVLVADGSVQCWGGRTGTALGVRPGDPLRLGIAAGWSDVCAYDDGLHVRCVEAYRGTDLPFPFPVTGIAAFEYRLCAWSSRGEGGCVHLGGAPLMRTPADVQVRQVAPATDHTCAVTTGGRVLCTGSNAFRQLGRDGDDTTEWLPVEGVSDVVAVAPGATHTCALTSRGRVSCWGSNAVGQVGDGRRSHGDSCVEELDCTPDAVRVEGLSDAIAIASGTFHTCALRRGGRVVCWGSNAFGRLGDGVERHGPPCGDADCSLVPVEVAGLRDVTDLAAGRMHNCARTGDGRVLCRGPNFSQQLGVPDIPWSYTPVEVEDLPGP